MLNTIKENVSEYDYLLIKTNKMFCLAKTLTKSKTSDKLGKIFTAYVTDKGLNPQLIKTSFELRKNSCGNLFSPVKITKFSKA